MVKKIRVLVVDDAAFMRDMVKKGLRATFPGFKVEEAHHGKKALEMLNRESYDLVLCDWEMPEMTGAELLEWMRANEATANTPFVMVTSRGDREHVVKAIELKANNYIVKPFTNDKLATVVGGVLTKAMGISTEKLKQLAGDGKPLNVGLSGALPVAEHVESTIPAARPKTPQKVTPSGKVLVSLRFSDNSVSCLLREISRERMVAVMKRGDDIPAILDLVVLDLEAEGQVSRLNGYVHTLQAREASSESEFVNVIVNLVDQDDQEKMTHLEAFMAAIA